MSACSLTRLFSKILTATFSPYGIMFKSCGGQVSPLIEVWPENRVHSLTSRNMNSQSHFTKRPNPEFLLQQIVSNNMPRRLSLMYLTRTAFPILRFNSWGTSTGWPTRTTSCSSDTFRCRNRRHLQYCWCFYKTAVSLELLGSINFESWWCFCITISYDYYTGCTIGEA